MSASQKGISMKRTQKGSTAVVVLLSILCFILVMCISQILLTAFTMRRYAEKRTIPTAVSRISLKDIVLQDDEGNASSAAEYIMDHYVMDDRVTLQNIENLLEQGSFTDFASTLTEQYNNFLLGQGEFPKLKAEDFVTLIEQNQNLIYNETGLQFLEQDKQKLQENLDEVFAEFNPVLERSMNKGATGFLVRSMFSVWMEIVLAVLLVLLLIWMICIYASNQKRVGTAVKVVSIAAFVPCIFALLGDFFMSLTLKRSEFKAFAEMAGYLTKESIPYAGIGCLICAALFAIGILCNQFYRNEAVEVPIYDANDFSTEDELPVYDAADTPDSYDHYAAPEPADRKYCRNCGCRLVNANAYFCYKCGNQQQKL